MSAKEGVFEMTILQNTPSSALRTLVRPLGLCRIRRLLVQLFQGVVQEHRWIDLAGNDLVIASGRIMHRDARYRMSPPPRISSPGRTSVQAAAGNVSRRPDASPDLSVKAFEYRMPSRGSRLP